MIGITPKGKQEEVTSWIPPEWKLVQDYDCLIRVTDLLLADNSKQAAKDDISEVKAQESNWINTAIGRMRKIGTMTIQSGKYAIVTITKWQSILGQTFYMKDMQKLDSQPHRSEEQVQKAQQSTLYDLAARSQSQSKTEQQSLNQVKSVVPAQRITDMHKTQRQFVLDRNSIAALLGNAQFKNNITVGKVLKIIQALIEGKSTIESIAKKFEVELAMVELIKSHVTSE